MHLEATPYVKQSSGAQEKVPVTRIDQPIPAVVSLCPAKSPAGEVPLDLLPASSSHMVCCSNRSIIRPRRGDEE